MSSRRRRLRALLGSVVLLLSVGLLVAALLENSEAIFVTATAVEDFQPLEFGGRGRAIARLKIGLVYVSKRRVPNGSDPIHNRREGKSVRPPGRA